jgi:hypothetical protein
MLETPVDALASSFSPLMMQLIDLREVVLRLLIDLLVDELRADEEHGADDS